MRTKWLALSSALLPMLGILGCSESLDGSNTATRPNAAPAAQLEGPQCGEGVEVTFFAGQTIDVGTVRVVNDEQQLCVEIHTTGGWVMEETHVAIAPFPEEFPQTGSGNPQVGRFALAAEHNPQVTDFEHCIDLTTYGYGPGDQIYVAVHGAVALLDAGGQVVQTETAWGDGIEFPGSNWAMYFGYVVGDCSGEPMGDGIELIYPNAAEEICQGSDVPINWVIYGECGDPVTIELLLDGEVCSVLAQDYSDPLEPNIFHWQGVEPCAGGETGPYTIRVSVATCGLTDVSDESFTIIACTGGE